MVSDKLLIVLAALLAMPEVTDGPSTAPELRALGEIGVSTQRAIERGLDLEEARLGSGT